MRIGVRCHGGATEWVADVIVLIEGVGAVRVGLGNELTRVVVGEGGCIRVLK